jgi:hypothetical protein
MPSESRAAADPRLDRERTFEKQRKGKNCCVSYSGEQNTNQQINSLC